MFKAFSVALLAVLIGSADAAAASSLTTLHAFCTDTQGARCLDGMTPVSRLIEIDGQFYGTTSAGGANMLGTVFRVTADGMFATVHSFCEQDHCPDGARPGRFLARGPGGAIYGVTAGGGLADGGTVFRLSRGGAYTLVHRFCSEARCTDGLQPVSVLFDGKGNLFGTAASGGTHGGGIAFAIDSGGTFRVIHNFCAESGCADGATPGPLMRARNGSFYGTTLAGGRNHAGTIFQMTPAGAVTILYAFCGANKCPDGRQPAGALVEGLGGNLYGATTQQGADNYGTIFQITPAGRLRTLHSFCAAPNCRDGATPTDGLVLGKDGSLYGTASAGGGFYSGAVFRLTAAGKYSLVYDFCARHGCFDGDDPAASPIFGSDGKLYGTTATGGAGGNDGTAYRLDP